MALRRVLGAAAVSALLVGTSAFGAAAQELPLPTELPTDLPGLPGLPTDDPTDEPTGTPGDGVDGPVGVYGGVAQADGIFLDLFGQFQLQGAVSTATVTSSPRAAATAIGFDPGPDSTSSVDVTSGVASDPSEGDRNCATPTPPEPFQNLDIDLACSYARGNANVPSASASGEMGDIDLDGTVVPDLVDFLADMGGTELAAQLDDALDMLAEAGSPLTQPLVDGLSDACAMGLEPLGDGLVTLLDELSGGLDMAPDEIADALQPLLDQLELLGVDLPLACQELVDLLMDPPSFEAGLEDVREALRAALAELDLVQIVLGPTTSDSLVTQGRVQSTSTAEGVRVVLPSLGAVTDALDEIVAGVLGGVVDQLSEQLGEQFDELIPSVEALLDPVLDGIMVPDLLDSTDPLLQLVVSPVETAASLDLDTGEFSTNGTAVTARIELSQAFATLLGENTTIEIPGGTTQSFGDGTPLASTIQLADAQPFSTEAGGLTLNGTRGAGVGLDLLTGVNGGITLRLSASGAAVGGQAAPAPAPAPEPTEPAPPAAPEPPSLPSTGGGLALAGVLALAGGAALWRRRD